MKAEYDKFAKKYIEARDPKRFSSNFYIEMPQMFQLVGNIEGKKLLDLGCGFGVHAEFYSKAGAKVIGIDASKKEIEYAKSLNLKNADFSVFDINKKLPFKENEFDIIACSLVLDYIKNLDKIFKECRRVLKPRGVLIFSIPNPIYYQENAIVGILEEDDGRVRIFGNYFKRRKIRHKWKSGIISESYHRTAEDFFNAFLKAGFKLEQFKEAEPIKPRVKLNIFDQRGWDFTSKNPYFLFFKLIK
jgi:ubiquinone/menaquinone biosynthesis C-methylase UbiE